MIRVGCRIPRGLSLRLTKPIEDGTGHPQMRQYGDPVVIAGPEAPGEEAVTEVDEGFWSAWLGQNQTNPLVVNESIRVAPDPEPEPEKA